MGLGKAWLSSKFAFFLSYSIPDGALRINLVVLQCTMGPQPELPSHGQLLTVLYTGWFKKMSPLVFKSNNSRPMSRTTLSDTAFERPDNFLSNECIHTRFPFQIASSQAANQKSSGFCVFGFQTDFDEREHFVLSSLYRNIAFIWSVKCAQNIPVPPEPPSSSHLT